jgi:hypothetical protein
LIQTLYRLPGHVISGEEDGERINIYNGSPAQYRSVTATEIMIDNLNCWNLPRIFKYIPEEQLLHALKIMIWKFGALQIKDVYLDAKAILPDIYRKWLDNL